MKPTKAASTAAQLNPAAASPDGPAAAGRDRVTPPARPGAGAAAVAVALAAGVAAGGCCGPTSVLTGETLPAGTTTIVTAVAGLRLTVRAASNDEIQRLRPAYVDAREVIPTGFA